MIAPNSPQSSTSTAHLRQIGESEGMTARALLGLFGCSSIPFILFFGPATQKQFANVQLFELMSWVVIGVTAIAATVYQIKRSLEKEATLLPVITGVGFVALLQTVGHYGTIGLVTSFQGWAALVTLLIVFVATIALMLDGVWEPFVGLLLMTIVLTWLAQAAGKEASLALLPMFLVGAASFASALHIRLQEEEWYRP